MVLPPCRLAGQRLNSRGPGSTKPLPGAFSESPYSFASRPNMHKHMSTRCAKKKTLVYSELRTNTGAGCVQFLRPAGRICPTVNTVAVAESWKSSALKNLRGVGFVRVPRRDAQRKVNEYCTCRRW